MQFRLGSIPVNVRPPFLFLALVLGASYERPDLIAIWTAIVFVSVLVHELGHALVGRMFGLSPRIELHGMGGTTSWVAGRDVGNARAIAISAAGPFAGFLIAGTLFLVARLGYQPEGPRLAWAFQKAFVVNTYWGIFNLLPLLPLDGGNVIRSALNALSKRRGEKLARGISIFTCALLVAFAAYRRDLWLVALALFFGYANVQGFRQADARAADAPLADAIEKAYVALERHDGAAAIAVLRPAMAAAASEDLRAIGLRVYSYALLLEGMWDELLPMLRKNAALIGVEELTRYATTAKELGRTEEAEQIVALVPRPRSANDFT